MNDDNISSPSRDKRTEPHDLSDKKSPTREERLREELRKNLRKRKGQRL